MRRYTAEKAKRKTKPIYNCFVAFQKAFDLKAGHHTGNTKITRDRQQTNTDPSRYGGKIKSSNQNWERHGRVVFTKVGMKQVDPISPNTFIT